MPILCLPIPAKQMTLAKNNECSGYPDSFATREILRDRTVSYSPNARWKRAVELFTQRDFHHHGEKIKINPEKGAGDICLTFMPNSISH